MPLNKTLVWRISNYGHLISTRFPRPSCSLARSLSPRAAVKGGLATPDACWVTVPKWVCLLLFSGPSLDPPPGPLGSYFSFGEARRNSNSFLVRLFPSYPPHPPPFSQTRNNGMVAVDSKSTTLNGRKSARTSPYLLFISRRAIWEY